MKKKIMYVGSNHPCLVSKTKTGKLRVQLLIPEFINSVFHEKTS